MRFQPSSAMTISVRPEQEKYLSSKERIEAACTKENVLAFDIYLDETTTNDLESIKIQCRKLKRENKLDIIIIDYLQLLTLSKGKSMSRYEEVSTLSRSLKLLARELEVPILALSQLSRNVESRSAEQGNKPILSDLRESGSIEQDADIVIFLHRETPAADDPTKSYANKKIEVIIAKNRHGSVGNVRMGWIGQFTKFRTLEDAQTE